MKARRSKSILLSWFPRPKVLERKSAITQNRLHLNKNVPRIFCGFVLLHFVQYRLQGQACDGKGPCMAQGRNTFMACSKDLSSVILNRFSVAQSLGKVACLLPEIPDNLVSWRRDNGLKLLEAVPRQQQLRLEWRSQSEREGQKCLPPVLSPFFPTSGPQCVCVCV